MSNQLDPKVAALLSAGSTDWNDAEPNTGQGVQGEWPPEGDHNLLILEVIDGVGTFQDGDNKIPCAEVTFRYEWLRDEKDPTFDPSKGPVVFRGEKFQLVPNADKVLSKDGPKTRARIHWERFAGHITKILNLPKEQAVNNLLPLYQKVRELVGTSKVVVSSRIEYREYTTAKNKKGTARTEYVLDRLS